MRSCTSRRKPQVFITTIKSHQMRILFISASRNLGDRIYREYPLGIGMLATIVQNAGHEVKVHDMAVETNRIEDIVSVFNPEIIGISFHSTSAHTAYGLLDNLKNITNAFFVAGGIHPTIFHEEALKKGFDFVVIGEGENTILPLINRIEKNRREGRIGYDMIDGLAYKNGNAIICKNPVAEVDLESLPFVDRDLYDLKHYSNHSIISSRGCFHKCMFCSSKGLAGCSPRMKSPERIVAEIEFLAAKYGPIHLYFADDMFFHNHASRIHFCNLLIQKKLPLKYVIQLRADNVNPELISSLKLSGCEKIAIGAEAGSNEILETIKKGITKRVIENAIICSKTHGVRIKTWWIVGLPGSYDRQLEALDVIRSTRPNEVAIHTFVPLPGSEFWDEAGQYGIHLPTSLEKLELGYYADPGNIQFDYLSKNEVAALIDKYEQELLDLGYIPTDEAGGEEDYLFTTPNQKKTFKV